MPFPRSRRVLHPQRVRTRLLLGLVVAAAGWALLAALALRVPPRWWWPVVFGGLTLPLALLLNGALLAMLAWRRRLLLLVPLGVLLLSAGYVRRGIALRWPRADEPPAATAPERRLRVLSYNVRIFNTYAHLRDTAATRRHISWLAAHPAEVLCLQEYYNQKRDVLHPKNRRPLLYGSTARLLPGRFGFVSKSLDNATQQFGLAIFARYPLLRKGTIAFGRLTQNHAMWADVRVPDSARQSFDTVRVYNVHFQSMALAEDDIVRTTRRRAWLDDAGLRLLRRFRNGAVKRSNQVDTLLAHVRACPYRVVVCGDFNDVPYSYTYDHLVRALTNAHEAAGAGVGSTYHGRLPLLRIDNQFCTPDRLVPIWARVRREIPYSDHFPLDVVYRW